MSDAIEAAAKVIDPLAFAEQGSCPPRGWEHSTPKEVARLLERRKSHALSVAKRIIAAYRDSEIEALRAQVATYEYAMEACRVTIVELQSRLADCQSVIRDRGHDWHCPAVLCEKCGFHENSSWPKESNDPNDWCIFEQKNEGSYACGHD